MMKNNEKEAKKKVKKENGTILPILPIGSMAQALQVNQRTLRIYDKEGILSPKRNEKNRRFYTLEDLNKGKAILFLTRNLLLNLSGVKMMLAVLEEENIELENYNEYLEKIATKANITSKVQQKNITKAAKRRRPKTKKEE